MPPKAHRSELDNDGEKGALAYFNYIPLPCMVILPKLLFLYSTVLLLSCIKSLMVDGVPYNESKPRRTSSI